MTAWDPEDVARVQARARADRKIVDRFNAALLGEQGIEPTPERLQAMCDHNMAAALAADAAKHRSQQSVSVDLGQHLVEVLEDQTVVLVERTQWKEMVRLDREEAYRLLVTLQWVFPAARSEAPGTESLEHSDPRTLE